MPVALRDLRAGRHCEAHKSFQPFKLCKSKLKDGLYAGLCAGQTWRLE